MHKPKWLKNIIGEISKLRFMNGAFGFNIANDTPLYSLDSSRVDYGLARGLYKNNKDDYKLGAGFAKPIIDTIPSFMGIPKIKGENDNIQEILDSFFNENISRVQDVHKNACRDGDCFVWITREKNNSILYPELKTKLSFNIIPPEQISRIRRDIVTGKPIEYILKSEYSWVDENNQNKKAIITQRISEEYKVTEIDGDMPDGMEPGITDNLWGFIPIVHFKNEGDITEEFGTSDLESVEPFMKAYHDVMLHAMQGSKMHSTPKMKLRVKDVNQFLLHNFGIDDPVKYAKDNKKIKLDGNEVLVLGESDDAEFIEVKSAIGSATDLLKFLFYCIVDASGIPEFIFGVHTPSSLSSVQEQMPILIRKVTRKRDSFAESWKHMARIILAMTSMAEGRKLDTYKTDIVWETIDPRDGKDVAQEILYITQALEKALSGEFISLESAVNFLGKYIKTMSQYVADDPESLGERDKILKTKLIKMRLEDGQFLDNQKNEIDKELARIANNV